MVVQRIRQEAASAATIQSRRRGQLARRATPRPARAGALLSGELGGDSSLSSSSTVGALLSVSAVAAPAKVLRRHRAHSSAEDWPVTKEDHELRRRLALEAQEEQARNEGRPLPKKTSKRRSVW